MARFIQRVKLDTPAGCFDRPGCVAGEAPGLRQSIEHIPRHPLDPAAPGGLPVVKSGAATQCESGEEWSARQGHRGFEVGRSIRGRQPLQLQEVDPARRWIQRDAGSIDDQSLVADRRAKGREGSPKGATGRFVVGVGPEHRRQLIAGERPSFGRHERDDCESLPRIDDDRATADLDFEGAEQPDPEQGFAATHLVTVSRPSHIP